MCRRCPNKMIVFCHGEELYKLISFRSNPLNVFNFVMYTGLFCELIE